MLKLQIINFNEEETGGALFQGRPTLSHYLHGRTEENHAMFEE
jgi:hypothetical protein